MVARSDSQRVQRDVALRWQSNSVFGFILSIDPAARKMVVVPQIAQSPPAPDSDQFTAGRAIPFVPGDGAADQRRNTSSPLKICNRATLFTCAEKVLLGIRKSPGDPGLEGGMRGILGTLLEVNGSSVRLQEFGTGKALSIAIPSSMVYRTTRELTNAGGTLRLEDSTKLATVQFSDLKAGEDGAGARFTEPPY